MWGNEHRNMLHNFRNQLHLSHINLGLNLLYKRFNIER